MQVVNRRVDKVRKYTWTHDFGDGAMAENFDPVVPVKILNSFIHFDAAVTTNVSHQLNAEAGENYDTVIKLQALSGSTDLALNPDYEIILLDGDTLDIVSSSDAGSQKAYGTIYYEEL